MNILSKAKNKYLALCVGASALVSGSAMAAEGTSSGADLSALTDSIDFSSILVAIMAIAASLVALYASYVGVRWVLRMVKGA